jgi:hypothetical protein
VALRLTADELLDSRKPDAVGLLVYGFKNTASLGSSFADIINIARPSILLRILLYKIWFYCSEPHSAKRHLIMAMTTSSLGRGYDPWMGLSSMTPHVYQEYISNFTHGTDCTD